MITMKNFITSARNRKDLALTILMIVSLAAFAGVAMACGAMLIFGFPGGAV